MMKPNLNAELGDNLGSEDELMQLVGKVRALSSTAIHPSQHDAVAAALRVIAKDVVRQHDEVVALRDSLRAKLATAHMHEELSGVLDSIKPTKKGWRRFVGL
jgi:hypothetical protein